MCTSKSRSYPIPAKNTENKAHMSDYSRRSLNNHCWGNRRKHAAKPASIGISSGCRNTSTGQSTIAQQTTKPYACNTSTCIWNHFSLFSFKIICMYPCNGHSSQIKSKIAHQTHSLVPCTHWADQIGNSVWMLSIASRTRNTASIKVKHRATLAKQQRHIGVQQPKPN